MTDSDSTFPNASVRITASDARSRLKRAGFALILFAAADTPAFAMVTWLHASVQITILLIIIVSAVLAGLFMAFLTRDTSGIGEFGIAKSPASYAIAATLAGIVVGGALAYLAALYPAPSPRCFLLPCTPPEVQQLS